MSLSITTKVSAIARAAKRLNQLGDYDRSALLYGIGAEVETQTHRRLRDEKTAPDGTPWPNWLAEYAATRHGGHSLLMGEGNLDDSIQSIISGDKVETGSNLPYAAYQNFGAEDVVTVPAHQRRITQAFGKQLPFPVWANISSYPLLQNNPARQFLGFSEQNLEALSFLVDDFIDGHLDEVMQ